MQMQFPVMSRYNKIIVITFVSMFVLASVLKQTGVGNLNLLLGLSTQAIRSGKVWSLITYPLLPYSLLDCLFTGLIFWFIGSELENLWGKTRYLIFLLTVVLGGAALYLAISFVFFSDSIIASIPYSGPAGVASTMCVAYGILFPRRTMFFFFFPMQARWFVAILVGMNLYNGFFSASGILAWGQIASIFSGVLWMISVSNPELKKIFTRTKKENPFEKPYSRGRKRTSKYSHLHIVEDSDDQNQESDENNDESGKPPTFH